MSRRVTPSGTSTSWGKRTLPVTAKTFVPRDFSTPYWAYHAPPRARMAGTAASVSTLLMAVGWPKRPRSEG